MKKNVKLVAVIGSVAAVISVVVIIISAGTKKTVGPDGRAKTGFSWGNIFGGGSLFEEDGGPDQLTGSDVNVEWLVDKMKERYGKRLSNKRVQVRMLGGLIRYYKRAYPYDWKERIKKLIAAEFPDYAVELSAKLDKLAELDAFMTENRDELRGIGVAKRREMIAEKRRELFGHEYDEIWEKEINRDRVTDLLARMDGKSGMTIDEKLREYRNFTKGLYSNEADRAAGTTGEEVVVRNYNLMNRFLGMDSVQTELGGMSAGERARFLKNLRESMGLDREMVKKMEEADRINDSLWENGAEYNRERNTIISNYDGEERARKLDAARKKYFGEHADLIKFEENTFNFNRFQFPRRWGM